MVRAGGSASRIIGDQGSTDPGGGVGETSALLAAADGAQTGFSLGPRHPGFSVIGKPVQDGSWTE